MLDQVRKWVGEQGFPLEMRTASAFREAGFEVTLSELYTDADTGKPREIDVLAYYPDYVGVTRIAFIVECKSSKRPWLLLCDPKVLVGHNRVHSFAAVNQNAVKALVEGPVLNSLMNECPWFRKEELTAYSLRNAFSDKDVAYEATLSVAKASMDFTRSAKDYQQFVSFPVIVVDSPIIRCSLDDNGQIQCEEIARGEVFFKYDLEKPFRTCIAVVRLEKLAEYAHQAWQVARCIRGKLLGAEAKLWQCKFSSPYPDDLMRLVEREHCNQDGE